MIERIAEKWKNKRFVKKWIPVLLLVLLLLGACGYTLLIKPLLQGTSYIYKEETVQRGDLVLGIMESGTVSLKETGLEYTIELETEEEDSDGETEDDEDEEDIKYPKIETVYVVSGQRIEEGEPLFKITDESGEAVRKRLNTLVTEAEIACTETQNEYAVQMLEAKSTYDTSMLEAGKADAVYQAAKARTRKDTEGLSADIQVLEEEIASCQKALSDEELWEELSEAQTAYDKAEAVFAETDVHNGAAYTSNYADYKSAKETLSSIQDKIDGWTEQIELSTLEIEEKREELALNLSVRETQELVNESSHESQVLGGELAEEIYEYTVSSLTESQSSAEADLEEAREQLEDFDALVGEDGIIYAAGSGLVTGVLYEAGDSISTAGSLMTYVEDNAYTISIDVLEDDIKAIAVGDRVEVALTAYPEEIYEGEVVSITTTAASDYSSTISYPVVIAIGGDTSKLYGGMTAEVTFTSQRVEDVLYVPKKAVVTVDGESYVYVQSGSKKERTIVQTGLSDGTNIQITEGLTEGQTIYIESKISGEEQDLYDTAADNAAAGGDEMTNPGEQMQPSEQMQPPEQGGAMPEMGGGSQ